MVRPQVCKGLRSNLFSTEFCFSDKIRRSFSSLPADHSRPMSPAIELIAINKSFGTVHANRDVNLRVERGTIHGIIGENGAGKSTLMSILYGFYEADAGEVRVNGQPVAIRSSADAIRFGIGMVHQHFMLVEPLTVVDNVMLGVEGGALLRSGEAKVRAELGRL